MKAKVKLKQNKTIFDSITTFLEDVEVKCYEQLLLSHSADGFTTNQKVYVCSVLYLGVILNMTNLNLHCFSTSCGPQYNDLSRQTIFFVE